MIRWILFEFLVLLFFLGSGIAFLLGFVLVKLESIFGIAKSTLYLLASLPCLFAIYDFYCFYTLKTKLGIGLKVIGISNLLYCCLSLGLAIYHRQELSYFGWTYILLEIFIVASIACFELKVAKSCLTK